MYEQDSTFKMNLNFNTIVSSFEIQDLDLRFKQLKN